MAVLTWPSSFSQTILRDGFGQSPANASRSTPFETGRTRIRSIGIQPVFVCNVRVIFSATQKSDFEKWFRFNLANGTRPFQMNFPVFTETYTSSIVRFRGENPISWSFVGDDTWMLAAQVTVDPTFPTPAVPSGLSLTTPSNTTINAAVTEVLGASFYDFEVDTDSGFSNPTAFRNITDPEVLLTGLTPNTAYFVRARASTGEVASAYSSSETETTTGLPTTPVNLALNGTGTGSIIVSWDADPLAVTYDIRVAETFAGLAGASITTGIGTNEFTITGLGSNDERFAQVRSVNAQGTSEFSDAASGTSAAIGVVPTNVVLTPSNDSIVVTWDDNAAATFDVRFATTSGLLASATPVTGLTDPTYTITGLSLGDERFFQVRSVVNAVESDYSTEKSDKAQADFSGTRDVSAEFDINSTVSTLGCIWSDGTTLYVVDTGAQHLNAYTLSTGARDVGKEFDLVNTTGPFGIWSDGTTVWITSPTNNTLHAYTLATGVEDPGSAFSFVGDNSDAYDMWSDGTTLYVVDTADDKIYAYVLATGARDITKEFDLDVTNTSGNSIWSDYTTMWVNDVFGAKAFAYDLETGARVPSKDFDLDAANANSRGIWSDGVNIWVADFEVQAGPVFVINLFSYT